MKAKGKESKKITEKQSKEDKKLLDLVEEIIISLPEPLRAEAAEKGFIIRTKEDKGELKFDISIPDASVSLQRALDRVSMKSEVLKK